VAKGTVKKKRSAKKKKPAKKAARSPKKKPAARKKAARSPKKKKPAARKKAARSPKKKKPAARKKAKPVARPSGKLTPESLAAILGVPYRAKLTGDEVRHLLKPYPGYRALLEEVVRRLPQDNGVLEIAFDVREVKQRLARVRRIEERLDILEQVGDGADAQRQVDDGFLMDVLLTATRRVREQADAHPDVAKRWADVVEFVAKLHPGSAGHTANAGTSPS
jgi:hypothetical protein